MNFDEIDVLDKIERDESSHMGWNGWHSIIQPCEWKLNDMGGIDSWFRQSWMHGWNKNI